MNARVLMLATLGMAGGLLVPGCSTYESPATGQEARYGFQTLRSELDVPIGRVYAAAKRAVDELGITCMYAADDGISGRIRALDAQWNTVEVCLGALPRERTLLRITIGVFGDKNKSIVLFERIVENLCRQEPLAAKPVWQWDRERWEMER